MSCDYYQLSSGYILADIDKNLVITRKIHSVGVTITMQPTFFASYNGLWMSIQKFRTTFWKYSGEFEKIMKKSLIKLWLYFEKILSERWKNIWANMMKNNWENLEKNGA